MRFLEVGTLPSCCSRFMPKFRIGVWFSLLAGLGLVVLTGCVQKQQKPAGSTQKNLQIYWPGPPDEPKFKYEWRLKALSDIHVPSEEERMAELVAGVRVGNKVAFSRPGGIAANKGRVYVADIQGQAVVVFDVPRRRVFKIGTREPNVLGKPIAVALDGQGRVFVLDAKAKKVMVFDPLGLYMFEVGDPSALVRPAGVAVNRAGDRIYIVDRGTTEGDDHRVYVYDDKNVKQFEIGPRGSANGQLNIPLDAAVDSEGYLYVVDSGNFRIQKFSADGKFVSSFGSVGRGLGQFSRPRSIAVGADGNIYVSDGVFNNVQIFDSRGQLLMPLGRYGIDEDAPGEFGLISGVTVDETNRLYVVDQFFNKVEVFKRME